MLKNVPRHGDVVDCNRVDKLMVFWVYGKRGALLSSIVTYNNQVFIMAYLTIFSIFTNDSILYTKCW